MSAIDRRKLAAVLALLSSDKPGERDAAAHAATRMVRRANLSWEQVLEPTPANDRHHADDSTRRAGEWKSDEDLLTAAQAKLPTLTGWELDFVGSIEKQL